MPADFRRLYEILLGAGIEFILIGGCAANLHGSPRYTLDMDVVYRRTRENMQRIADTLAPFHPYLRGAPPGLPFTLDLTTLRNGLNFTLTTSLGDLDLLGEVAGDGTYDKLLPFVERKEAFGLSVPCVSLEKLIALKRAAGRPKDFEPIAELEAIRQERLSGRTDFQP
jgi:hypothetical protein